MLAVSYVFYQNYITFYCFLLISILPLLSLGLMLAQWRHAVLSLSFSKEEYERNSEITLSLSYTGKQIPYALCTYQGVLSNSFYGCQKPIELTFFTNPSIMTEQSLPSQRCGCYEVSIKELLLYDVLGLWCKKSKVNLHAQAYVMPAAFQSVSIQQMVQTGTEKEKETTRKGDASYTDAYEIREYREGDSLKNLHHKLTFKLQKPMIREFARMEQALIYLYLDLSGDEEEVEQTLALCYSVALAYVKENQRVMCCWGSVDTMNTQAVETVPQVHQLLRNIISGPRANEAPFYSIGDGISYQLKGYAIKEVGQGGSAYGA